MTEKDLELIAGTIEQLRAAVLELPEVHRRILLLHRFDRLSQDDIAARLGVDAPKVERLLSEALDHLTQAVYNKGGK